MPSTTPTVTLQNKRCLQSSVILPVSTTPPEKNGTGFYRVGVLRPGPAHRQLPSKPSRTLRKVFGDTVIIAMAFRTNFTFIVRAVSRSCTMFLVLLRVHQIEMSSSSLPCAGTAHPKWDTELRYEGREHLQHDPVEVTSDQA